MTNPFARKHGLTVGWVWWSDDDMAANCEYVPAPPVAPALAATQDASTVKRHAFRWPSAGGSTS